MIGALRGVSVWAYGEPCDMRKSFNTLQALVEGEMKGEIATGDLFLFVAKDSIIYHALGIIIPIG